MFAVPSILERATSAPGRVRALTACAAGGALPMAGALLGLAGGGLWDALDGCGRQAFTAILYSLFWLVAIGYALTQFGLWRWQGSLGRMAGPALPAVERPARRSFVLGAAFGPVVGIACPMPTYYALLALVAVAASPWYGAVALGAYGLGRIAWPVALGAGAGYAGWDAPPRCLGLTGAGTRAGGDDIGGGDGGAGGVF